MSKSILDLMNDEQKAAVNKVQRETAELNKALCAAAEAGIEIEIDSVREDQIGRRASRRLISATVKLPSERIA